MMIEARDEKRRLLLDGGQVLVPRVGKNMAQHVAVETVFGPEDPGRGIPPGPCGE